MIEIGPNLAQLISTLIVSIVMGFIFWTMFR